MDPVTLIVSALMAGAAAGVKDTASKTVKDAYAGLRAAVKARLGEGVDAELVLARHEQAPQAWEAALRNELGKSGADKDRDLIAAAQALLDLTGAAGAAGKYAVDARGALGVQVGDHNRQEVTFREPQRAWTGSDDQPRNR